MNNNKMKEKIMKYYSSPTKIIIVFFVMFLVTNSAVAQSTGDPFEGIENSKVLPMLKHLPRRYGGMNVPASDGRLLYDLIIEKGDKRRKANAGFFKCYKKRSGARNKDY